jgi:hypothetical protein
VLLWAWPKFGLCNNARGSANPCGPLNSPKLFSRTNANEASHFHRRAIFSPGLQSHTQAERRTAMRNPKQGQCASPPHVSKRRSCREERVDLLLREAHGSQTRSHHGLSPDERSGIRIGDLNCLGLRSAPLLQEAAARNCSLNCPAETLSTFRSMTGPEAMNSASSSFHTRHH